MTFEEMLDQALAMLQRHGRLTYRTLQRQFCLDDDTLNDLKDALLYSHLEVQDDAGRGLVWTGESSRASQRALADLVRYYGDAGVLVLVRALLQREGRLSYRSLTRICGLDEEGLADLREDLLFQGLVRDEDGKGLVWAGSAPPPGAAAVAFDTATRAAAVAPPLAADSTPSAPSQEEPTLAPEPSRRAPEAERRQVTVMFCDLVASTELSQQLDPEDYRAVVRAYQAAAAAALQAYDGYIARYLGDGLLVYFGWPQAHEDAAHRAVHASLALLDALDPLHDTHLLPHYGVRIAVRIGLHTGMAVIGEMGGGKHRQARGQAEQLLPLAQGQGGAAPLVGAHRALGQSLCYIGEAAQAHEHFVQSVALYDPQQHRTHAFRYSHDLGVAVLVNDALMQWTLGYPDQALRRSHEACRLAEDLAHPLTLAFAFAHLAMFHQYRREREEARRYAEAATRISREQGFPFWLGVGLILQNWARATRPQPAEQIPSMHEGMALYRATGAALWLPYFLALLAETYGAAGQSDAGLRLWDEAHTVTDSTQERFYEAEVYRVQGELVLAQAVDQQAQAETCFQHAIDVARRQQARAWELRAAMSLARLWQQHGKWAEARALLAPLYGWFTEGFDTADLQEARALLNELT